MNGFNCKEWDKNDDNAIPNSTKKGFKTQLFLVWSDRIVKQLWF